MDTDALHQIIGGKEDKNHIYIIIYKDYAERLGDFAYNVYL